jgi:aspartyl-tRNA synthetase
MSLSSRYRSHTCADLTEAQHEHTVRLCGWIHRKRDHGQLVFVDLRDHYGITQCVFTPTTESVDQLAGLRLESVLSLAGQVRARTPQNINPASPTGRIEVAVDSFTCLSAADALPFMVNGTQEIPEEQRLRYRFLDLRRTKLHQNIVLRSKVISSLRRRMQDQGFFEYTTPILTSSSPEGARDYLVPSRLHPGKFYALPQAPQQFKQLLMVAGFDRYFQIAPCFRDEDARADRSPGEFYQLDIEMAFVEQEDVFAAIEPVLHEIYQEFGSWPSTPPPFPRIPYDEAMLRFGTDKPDLRNPLELRDVSPIFAAGGFAVFAQAVANGSVVRALVAPQAAARPRSFFDGMVALSQELGLGGLAYVSFAEPEKLKGTLAKFIDPQMRQQLADRCDLKVGDSVFFICASPETIARPCDRLRQALGERLDLIEKDTYRFVWIVDFPFYERHPQTGKLQFAHNPFSMPQGGLEALNTQDPLALHAYQYDIVCNGIELSSGAIRNHRPDIMLRAFELAGYSPQEVKERFGGMMDAFRFGAPPHGGLAPGIDRMVMQLAQEPNIREVIAFPMTQQAQDLMMQAPAAVSPTQLAELHLACVAPEPEPQAPTKPSA